MLVVYVYLCIWYFRYITQEKPVVKRFFVAIFKPNFKHDSKCKYFVVWLHLWQAALTESEKFAETAESEVIFVFVLGGLELCLP